MRTGDFVKGETRGLLRHLGMPGVNTSIRDGGGALPESGSTPNYPPTLPSTSDERATQGRDE